MPTRYVLLDVFTDTVFTGNQLAVVPDAVGLSGEQMHKIANEFNLPETTFVLPPRDRCNTHQLRIFTPTTELPFAGHPTIGSGGALAYLGLAAFQGSRAELRFEEGVGTIAVSVTKTGGGLYGEMSFTPVAEQPTHRSARSEMAAAISLPPEAVVGTWAASVGVPFCFIQLRERSMVDTAALYYQAWHTHFADAWAQQLYLFAGDLASDSDLYARMFAPALGISEDPATGSAAAALAAITLATHRSGDRSVRLRITQGVKLGRPSHLTATATRTGEGVRVTVGGHVVVVGEGMLLDLPGT